MQERHRDLSKISCLKGRESQSAAQQTGSLRAPSPAQPAPPRAVPSSFVTQIPVQADFLLKAAAWEAFDPFLRPPRAEFHGVPPHRPWTTLAEFLPASAAIRSAFTYCRPADNDRTSVPRLLAALQASCATTAASDHVTQAMAQNSQTLSPGLELLDRVPDVSQAPKQHRMTSFLEIRSEALPSWWSALHLTPTISMTNGPLAPHLCHQRTFWVFQYG